MPFIGWLLLGGGFLLIYSGLTNRNPRDELVAALRGDARPGKGAFSINVQNASAGAGLDVVPLSDSGGASAGSGTTLSRPISGPITSGYGMRNGRMHHGVDIPASSGTAIKAAASGTVLTNSYEPAGAGFYVTLKHSGGLYTKYFHMVRRSDVSVGSTIRAGQVIGNVGSTGNSSGPHLHFEVHEGGTGYGSSHSVDPRKYIS